MSEPMTVIRRIDVPIAEQTDKALTGYRRTIAVTNHRTKPLTHVEVWYEAQSPSDAALNVRFYVHGTDQPFSHRTGYAGVDHVGTLTTALGANVWHVYAEYPIMKAGSVA